MIFYRVLGHFLQQDVFFNVYKDLIVSMRVKTVKIQVYLKKINNTDILGTYMRYLDLNNLKELKV